MAAKIISKRTRAYRASLRDALEVAAGKAVQEARGHVLSNNLSLDVAARIGVAKHGGDFPTVMKILRRFRKRELRAKGHAA